MEFAVRAPIPNYAGGLGILAADYLFSLADKDYPAFGVSLMYHGDPNFDPSQYAVRLDHHVTVRIEDRDVKIGVWQYQIHGKKNKSIPLFLLTTDVEGNEQWDRDICKFLYPGDQYTRLCQEAILGIGGVRVLRDIGHDPEFFHLNEGHSALLTLELLRENNYDENAVRKITRFTTHTPIPAGHDHFDYELAHRVIGAMLPWHIRELATNENLSMTHLALNLSGRSNGVSEKHRDICNQMFSGRHFENVTNGVYLDRWAAPPTQKMLDKYIPGWREKPELLRHATHKIPTVTLKNTKQKNKQELIDWLNIHPEYLVHNNLQPEDKFDPEVLTIGFARRVVPYKRTALIFHDLDRLRDLGYKKLQIVFAGPFHPGGDMFDDQMLAELQRHSRQLRGQIRVAVIPAYNIDISRHLIAGCDMWLNTPIPPREASGTSGMKASLNGNLNLSIPDGWWIEAQQLDPKTGWSFGGSEHIDPATRDASDASALYDTLEEVIDLYDRDPREWIHRCKHAISISGDFSSHRAIDEYESKMWQ